MIGVGLYGSYGHQIHELLFNHPRAKIVAAAGLSDAHLGVLKGIPFRRYENLAQLLADDSVKVVSLCSPTRGQQEQDALLCLEAGKHVYAEKPAALSEAQLDKILATAARVKREFHEMAGTVFLQPYLAMRRAVQSGALGDVVQILAQKCYPMHNHRPQDESTDGGLLLQAGVHAARMVEHISLQKAVSVEGWETQLGNPQKGELRIASTFTMPLANGGLGIATANYLNPKGTGIWGYEAVTVYGTKGLIESHREGGLTRMVIGEIDYGPLNLTEPGRDYFDYFLDVLTGAGPMPLSLEDELHPTRMVLRAKVNAMAKLTYV